MSVPCPPGTTVHIVQRGDTLYALAVRYQTSVTAIIAANSGINPNVLYIGQPVCIPRVIACPRDNIYMVQPGDTLFLIATRYDVSFGALAEFNPGLDPNRIYPGQRLCIPPVQPISCPGNNAYVIQPDENLSLIAEKFTVSATDILMVNPGLRPSEFTPGKMVCIPLNQAPV
jgi:LysM repeat protein